MGLLGGLHHAFVGEDHLEELVVVDFAIAGVVNHGDGVFYVVVGKALAHELGDGVVGCVCCITHVCYIVNMPCNRVCDEYAFGVFYIPMLQDCMPVRLCTLANGYSCVYALLLFYGRNCLIIGECFGCKIYVGVV